MLFFTSWSWAFRTASMRSPVSGQAFRAAMTASLSSMVRCLSSKPSSHAERAAFRVSSFVSSSSSRTSRWRRSRCWRTLRTMPREYSALFSKRELERAGPRPLGLVV